MNSIHGATVTSSPSVGLVPATVSCGRSPLADCRWRRTPMDADAWANKWPRHPSRVDCNPCAARLHPTTPMYKWHDSPQFDPPRHAHLDHVASHYLRASPAIETHQPPNSTRTPDRRPRPVREVLGRYHLLRSSIVSGPCRNRRPDGTSRTRCPKWRGRRSAVRRRRVIGAISPSARTLPFAVRRLMSTREFGAPRIPRHRRRR